MNVTLPPLEAILPADERDLGITFKSLEVNGDRDVTISFDVWPVDTNDDGEPRRDSLPESKAWFAGQVISAFAKALKAKENRED